MAFPLLKRSSERSLNDLVGFDLNEERLKLVHVHAAPMRRQVSALATFDVRGKSDADIAVIVREWTAKLGAKKPRAFITVPLSAVITRSIEIPSLDPTEIREIVNLQASRHTPYSRSEIIIDILDLGVIRENYSKVLLVIVPKEVVVRQGKILQIAGLNLEKVFFPPEGIAHACVKIMGGEASDKVTAIVHMDNTFTSFIAVQKGQILFVRGISVGASHLLEEKDVYADRFVDELHKSVESYTADEAGPPPSLLLLTGVVAEISDLDYLFSTGLNMPVKHQTYFKHFQISDDARAVAASASKEISFFNVIAPMLLFDRMQIDLITDERKLQMQLERRGHELMHMGACVLVLLILAFGAFASKVYFKSAYLSGMIKRYQPVRDDARLLEQTFSKTQMIKDRLYNRGNSIDVLSALYDSLPRNVMLSNIRYEDAGTRFSVKGTSAAMASVFTFVTNLEKSQKFKNVKTKYVTSRNEGGADVADFEIVTTIDPEAGRK